MATGRGNFLTVETVDPAGERLEYEFFFRIHRRSGRLLRIYVESAYLRDAVRRDDSPAPLKHRRKMRGKVLLAKTLRRQPITSGHGRRGDRQ